jgi:hypothetical protein
MLHDYAGGPRGTSKTSWIDKRRGDDKYRATTRASYGDARRRRSDRRLDCPVGLPGDGMGAFGEHHPRVEWGGSPRPVPSPLTENVQSVSLT